MFVVLKYIKNSGNNRRKLFSYNIGEIRPEKHDKGLKGTSSINLNQKLLWSSLLTNKKASSNVTT